MVAKSALSAAFVAAHVEAELKKSTNHHNIRRLKLFAEYLLSFQLPSMPAVRVK